MGSLLSAIRIAAIAYGLLLSSVTAAEFELSAAERAWVAAHPVVRIQMSDTSPPFEFKAGEHWQGLSYDYLQAACARIGIRIEETGMRWSPALEAITSGEGVDLLLAVTRSEEREQQMLLTDPYVSFPQVIIAARRSAFISGLSDLNGKRIAVENEYVMESWLRRDVPEARLFVVNDTLPALMAVSEGNADAYVGNLALASYLIEKHGLMNLGVAAPSGYGNEEFSMGIRKDWPELVSLLNRAMSSLTTGEHQAMRNTWLAVRYEFGWRTRDIVLWVLVAIGVAMIFILQLRRMVKSRTIALAREVELRRERERHLSEAQGIAHLGSWTRDVTNNCLTWSEETYHIVGLPVDHKPTFTSFLAIVHPDDRERLKLHQGVAERSADPVECEFRIRKPSGEERTVFERCRVVRDATGVVRRFEGIILDVTERKRAESERDVLEQSLRHAEKLRVIGQLTGGIAHDFNNLLGGISGHAEMLQRQASRSPDTFDDRARNSIASIRNAAERAAGITAQLRIFSRRDDLVASPTDIHRLIHETVELIGRTMPSQISVQQDLHAEQCVVNGDASLIQTAIVNLAINARDAMPHGGVIRVRTEEVSLAGNIEGALNLDLKPGAYIKISVADTGVGMDATIQARLFEPFFTTKELGKGTGLGLASVFGCVKSHGGAITVVSELGKGSEFGIYLPLAMGMHEVVQPQSSHIDHRGDGGTIMVVDDDSVLRNLAAEVLRDHGYAVIECEGVKEAEAFFLAHASAVELVIMDMIMPGADGHEGIARLRAIDPGIPVVVCSGAFPGEPAHAIESANGFLQKPYQLKQLVQVVATTKRARGERPGEP